MAKEIVGLSIKDGPDRLADLLAAVFPDGGESSRWMRALESGGRVDVRLIRPTQEPDRLAQQQASGHVPAFGPGRHSIDLANFCLLAVEAGYDWAQGTRVFRWLIRNKPVALVSEPCSLGRGCVMKFHGATMQEPHSVIPVHDLLELTPEKMHLSNRTATGQSFTEFMMEILAAVQKLVRERLDIP